MKKVNYADLAEKIKDQEKNAGRSNKQKDERIYQPKINEDGTAQALVRFLPSNDTDIPFVKKYSHGFQSINGWFIEDCPTSIGKKCPTCTANSVAWNSGDEDTARQRARRLSVYSNILIVKDPQTPENEGKVFLYRYGKRIHEKIMLKIDPGKGSIDEPVMIFDPDEGANFKLKIKLVNVKGKKMPNYDASEFEAPSKIDAKTIKKIENSLYNLAPEVDESSFKSYSELEERFLKVIGQDGSSTKSEFQKSPEITIEKKKEEVPFPSEETNSDVAGDKEDPDGFFANLQGKDSDI